MIMGKGAGMSGKGLGSLVLAAGLALAGIGSPRGLLAQTTDGATDATTAPATGPVADTTGTGLSLGIAETPAAPPVAPVPPGFTFNTVKVQGNVHVDLATVVSYLGVAKGKPVTAAELNDAYQRIFASGLFQRVELVPQKNTLLIKVIENPVIGTVDFQGNARISDTDLAKIAKSKSRQVYSAAQAEADVAAMTAVYRSKSRLAAKITPRIIRRADNQVDLVFEVTEGGVAEIARLSFVGNRAFSDYRLRQVLSSKQAGILHNLIQRDSYQTDRVELDKRLLSDFYMSRGFIDFQILDVGATYARNRDATFLTFTIQEGQSFRIGAVGAVSEVPGVDAAAFQRLLRIRAGETYSPTLIQQNVDALESLALQKSLNFVMVEPRLKRNERNGTIDVTFAVIKGQRAFVERIDIEGNTTTLDQVIRRQFHSVEGDPMNPHEIAQSAERIRALGFFSDVSVTEEPGTAPDQSVVKVAVTEQPTGSLTIGATYGVSAGFGVNLGFAETNFLGRGQGLTVQVQSGADDVDSQLQFTEPAFLGRDLTFALSANYVRTTHKNATYDTQTIGISPSIGFAVSNFGSLSLRYSLAQNQTSNFEPTSSPVLKAEAGSTIASSVGYAYTWDNRQSGLHPNRGVMVQFGQDVAGVGGQAKYINTSMQALAETKVLHNDVSVRLSFEGGVVSSYGGYTSTVRDRTFRAGTMRGFQPDGIGPRDLTSVGKDALGGNLFAAAHLEGDFPLGLPEEYGVTGGAFMEVGSVWGLDKSAKALLTDPTSRASTDAHLRSVVGVSLFWKTPIGPLRFDFTHALKKESYDKEQTFNFTISAKF